MHRYNLVPVLAALTFVSVATARPIHPIAPGEQTIREGYLSVRLDDAQQPKVLFSTAWESSASNEDSNEVVNGHYSVNLVSLARQMGPKRLVVVWGTGTAKGQLALDNFEPAPASIVRLHAQIERDALARYKSSYVPSGDPQVDAIRVTNLYRDNRNQRFSVMVENRGGFGAPAFRRVRQYEYDMGGDFDGEMFP